MKARPLIHIVDDDPAVRDSLKLFLETRGYEVEAFESGAKLLGDGAHRAEVKCLILDVNLPGDNGFDVLAKLRQNGSTVPAIFVSAHGSSATRARAQRAQAAAFFDKPVPPSELLAAIAKATGHT